MNYLWRQRMKKVTGVGTGGRVESNPVINPPVMSDKPETVDMERDRDRDRDRDEKATTPNNVHRHPVTQFASHLNEVTTTLENEGGFYEDDIQKLLTIGKDLIAQVDEGMELSAFRSCLEYLTTMLTMMQAPEDEYPFQELYITYFYATNHLKRAGDAYDQFIAEVLAPDSYFEWDAEFIPEELPEDAVLSWKTRHAGATDDEIKHIHAPYTYTQSAKATTHNLSLRQMIIALRKVYNIMDKTNGMWALTNVMFSGLSKSELNALVEEGLIKVQGGKFTLTRQGWEKPQWYTYANLIPMLLLLGLVLSSIL